MAAPLAPGMRDRCLGRRDSHADQGAVATQFSSSTGPGTSPQDAAQAIEIRPRHGVLEARQSRLRAQGRAVERIALEQQLVDRVVGQLGRVVAVGVAARQAEHALTDQVAESMGDLAGLPTVADGAGQPHRQAQPVVDRLHQDGAAVGTGVRLIEAGNDRLGNPVDPEGAVRYTGWLGGSSLSSFANNPG